MNLGQNILEDFQPFIDAILADAREHQDWPDDAVFKVNYRTKCWPCGFDDPINKYFQTKAEVEAWEKEYSKWASQDGNSVEYTIYEWDLGPNVIRHNWF